MNNNNAFARTARTIAEPFVVPYTVLCFLGVLTLVVWLIEWGFNIYGYGTVNTFLTIVIDIVVLFFGMQPLFVAYSGQFGLILSAVNLKDPREGATKAVQTHFKVVLWMIFANTLVGLMLSTIPFGDAFGNAAMAFPNLLLLVVAAILFGYLFEINGAGTKKKFVAGFLVLVLGILVWNYVGSKNREAVASTFKDGKEVASSLLAGCPEEIAVQTKQTTGGFDGSILELDSKCARVLDFELARVQQQQAGKDHIYPQVDVIDVDDTLDDNAIFFEFSPVYWVANRPKMKVIPIPEAFAKAGVKSIKIKAYNRTVDE